MKVLGMSSGLNEFHDFANVNTGVQGLSLREIHLRLGGRNCKWDFRRGGPGRLQQHQDHQSPQPGSPAALTDLPALASTQQIERSDNQCGHQQQMDQSTRHVKPPTQKPEDDQNGNHGPKHRLTVQGRNLACQAVRSCFLEAELYDDPSCTTMPAAAREISGAAQPRYCRPYSFNLR